MMFTKPTTGVCNGQFNLVYILGRHSWLADQSHGIFFTSSFKETSVKAGSTCFHAGFLLSLLFYPEDEGDMFLRNVG
jgi:hypothetical protein